MRKAWFKLTRNATGRQLLWELVTTESSARSASVYGPPQRTSVSRKSNGNM